MYKRIVALLGPDRTVGLKHIPAEQMEKNRKLSKFRARIEHVFGRMTQMGNLCVRTIGITRATTCIGLQNLVYNIDRFVYLAK